MDAAVRDLPSALAALDDEWRALWERDPSSTLFHRPEYAHAWIVAFGSGERTATIEARRDDALIGLANFVVRDGTLRFLGDADITDYLGPISALADRDDVAQRVVASALDLDGWTVAELEGLAADSGWVEPLARAGKAAGLLVDESRQDVCPRLSIEGGYDAYLERLPGKLRHEIKRKARRLEREAGAYTMRLSDRATLADDLERFFEMHRLAGGPKGRFLHWGMEGMFKLIGRAFDELGWLRLIWLEIEGEPLAVVFGFRDRGTFRVYNSGFDPNRRALSPGMVVMAETIKLAADEGCTTFDFLRGSEEYKYRLGATDVPLVRVTLRRV